VSGAAALLRRGKVTQKTVAKQLDLRFPGKTVGLSRQIGISATRMTMS
jgi:hypothetical protein